MRISGPLLLGLAVAGSSASAAHAAERQKIAFNVGGTALTVSLPEGFCAPTGDDIAREQLTAAADNDNVTHLMAVPCKGAKVDPTAYYLVKTPKKALLATQPRAALLATVAPEFDQPGLDGAFATDVNAKTSKAVSDLFSQKVDVSSALKPLGHDDVCAYMGGTLRFSAATGAVDMSMGGCLTSVGDKVLIVYRYVRGTDPAAIAELVRLSREFAESISPTAAD